MRHRRDRRSRSAPAAHRIESGSTVRGLVNRPTIHRVFRNRHGGRLGRHPRLSTGLPTKNDLGEAGGAKIGPPHQITPGAYTTEPFDHWEEVFIYQGDLVFGRNMKARRKVYEAPANAIGRVASRTGHSHLGPDVSCLRRTTTRRTARRVSTIEPSRRMRRRR